MKENKLALYFNMILGTVGTLLIALAAIGYQAKINNGNGFAIIILGFALTMGYINYWKKRQE